MSPPQTPGYVSPSCSTAITDPNVRKQSAVKINFLQLDLAQVCRLAEKYRLAITIRPDGSIFGFERDLKKLRSLILVEANHETGCRCETCRYE